MLNNPDSVAGVWQFMYYLYGTFWKFWILKHIWTKNLKISDVDLYLV